MAARKRRKAEMLRDLALVASCDAAGLTQAQTLEAVNADRAERGLVAISRSQISYDLAKARAQFGALTDEEVREATGRRLAQIEFVIRAANQGFLRSFEDGVRTTKKTTSRRGKDSSEGLIERDTDIEERASMYLMEVQCPQPAVGGVYSVLHRSRGHVFEETPVNGTPLCLLKAFLPAAESFGFAEKLRGATGGQAFPQMFFHHWEVVESDPLAAGSTAANIVASIRKRKGLKGPTPLLADYLDKL